MFPGLLSAMSKNTGDNGSRNPPEQGNPCVGHGGSSDDTVVLIFGLSLFCLIHQREDEVVGIVDLFLQFINRSLRRVLVLNLLSDALISSYVLLQGLQFLQRQIKL
jgi:hypothetical protein